MAIIPNRITLATAKDKKNGVRRTCRAPQASTNGESGNGGGNAPAAPSATAPFSRILFCTDLSLCSGSQNLRLSSPTLAPTRKVNQAPATDPAVARIGNSHTRFRYRAVRMTTAPSTAAGRKKTIDESSAARTTSPRGERKRPKMEAKNLCIVVGIRRSREEKF